MFDQRNWLERHRAIFARLSGKELTVFLYRKGAIQTMYCIFRKKTIQQPGRYYEWGILITASLLCIGVAGLSYIRPVTRGLTGHYYLTPDWRGVPYNSARDVEISHHAPTFQDAQNAAPEGRFSVEWRGYIEFARTDKGVKFWTNSDDGSWLWIDDQLVVDNGGSHGLQEVRGTVAMTPGLHTIRIRYLQTGGSAALQVFWEQESNQRIKLTSEILLPDTVINFLRYHLSPWTFWLFMAGSALFVIMLWRLLPSSVKAWLRRPPFYASATIVVGVFLLTRLSFYLYYSLPLLSKDTVMYHSLAEQIAHMSDWPQFIVRTPGYPIFIWLVTSVVDTWHAVIAMQSALAVISALILLYSLHRLRQSISFLAAFAIAAFIGSSQVLMYEVSVLAESIYTSSLFFAFAWLIIGLKFRSWFWLSCSSLAMAFVICVRPNGVFLIVIYGLVGAFLLWNHYVKSVIFSFLLPLPLMLLCLCWYNYLTIQSFTISALSECAFAQTTLTYWETAPSFPDNINRIIQRLPIELAKPPIEFPEDGRKIMHASWNPEELYGLFQKFFSGYAYKWTLGFEFYDSSWNSSFQIDYKQQRLLLQEYNQQRPLLKKISRNAIRRHPDLYLKFVYSTTWHAYFETITQAPDFYEHLRYWASNYYQRKRYSLDALLAKEIPNHPPSNLRINDAQSGSVELRDAILKRWHERFQTWHKRCFHNRCWMYAYIAIFLLSCLRLCVSKGQVLEIFIVFILTFSTFGANLVICLTSHAIERYTYPMQFVYYLSVACMPLLLSTKSNIDERK